MWRSLLAVPVLVALSMTSPALAEQTTWRFDNLKRVGGFAVTAEGSPHLIKGPHGKAVRFDGKADSLFIDGRPLVGA